MSDLERVKRVLAARGLYISSVRFNVSGYESPTEYLDGQAAGFIYRQGQTAGFIANRWRCVIVAWPKSVGPYTSMFNLSNIAAQVALDLVNVAKVRIAKVRIAKVRIAEGIDVTLYLTRAEYESERAAIERAKEAETAAKELDAKLKLEATLRNQTRSYCVACLTDIPAPSAPNGCPVCGQYKLFSPAYSEADLEATTIEALKETGEHTGEGEHEVTEGFCRDCYIDIARRVVPPCALGHKPCGNPRLCAMYRSRIFLDTAFRETIQVAGGEGEEDTSLYAEVELERDGQRTELSKPRPAVTVVEARVLEANSAGDGPWRRGALLWPKARWHYGGPYMPAGAYKVERYKTEAGTKTRRKLTLPESSGWYALPDPPQGWPGWKLEAWRKARARLREENDRAERQGL